MKRLTLLLIFGLSFCIISSAQPSQRQKMIHMAAVRIAEQIAVPEASKDAFTTLYQSYKKESCDIMAVRPQSSDETEAAAEQKILSDFDKSEKILSLRKKYYFKFRELISPTQIQKMYNIERAMISAK